jgi:hypothetical protein
VPGEAPRIDSIALSVVVPTCHGWPSVRPCLERLRDQAQACGAEVIVADGSAGPAPPAGALWNGVVWLRDRGAGVFALRALARRAARGAILAVTEDHCLVAPDWCLRILQAHAARPDAVAVKGTVRNGTADRLGDRASYLVVHAPSLPPFEGRKEDAILGISCASYRRQAVDRLVPELTWPVEIVDTRRWRAAGQVVVADPRIWVEHHQSEPLLALSALHYDNARAIAGLCRNQMTLRDWGRLAATPILPFVRTARTLALCARKRVPWTTLAVCAPLFVWFFLWKAAGEVMGYLAGPGDSGTRL